MRRALAAVALLALCAAVPAAARAETSVLVKTEPLARQKIADTITGYGRVHADPDNESSIALLHDGLVDRMYVRLGERVAAGQPLLDLETAPAARMGYEQAEAAVGYARSEVARLERLLEEKLATRDQVAAARQNLVQAEAKLETEKKLGSGLGRETLRAPFDGIVTKMLVTQGARVAANTTALIIARGGALIVPLGVEPEDAKRVKPGAPVTLVSVFEPSLTIAEKVDRVHAMVDPATRLVDVIVRVTEPDAAKLTLGLMIRGEIALSETEAFVVPESAVLWDDKGAYVFVVEDGRARRVTVEIGAEQGDRMAISGDLAAGGKVVVQGNYELTDGAAVREQGP